MDSECEKGAANKDIETTKQFFFFTKTKTLQSSFTAKNSLNTRQYNTIQYNTIQYNTIQYNTVQYNTIQYDTIQ